MKVEIKTGIFGTLKNDTVIVKRHIDQIIKFTFTREDHPELFKEEDKKKENIKKMREDWKI